MMMVLLLLWILGHACWRLCYSNCPNLLLSLVMAAMRVVSQALLRSFLQVMLELQRGTRLLLGRLLLKSSSQNVLFVNRGNLGFDR